MAHTLSPMYILLLIRRSGRHFLYVVSLILTFRVYWLAYLEGWAGGYPWDWPGSYAGGGAGGYPWGWDVAYPWGWAGTGHCGSAIPAPGCGAPARCICLLSRLWASGHLDQQQHTTSITINSTPTGTTIPTTSQTLGKKQEKSINGTWLSGKQGKTVSVHASIDSSYVPTNN